MRKKIDIAEKLEKLSKEEKGAHPGLSAKRASEIEERPIVGPSGLPYPSSIRDLIIPESSFDMFTVEITIDPEERERATQLLGLRDDPNIKLLWTVLKDPEGSEFEEMKKERLARIKSYIPMFGGELSEGALLASHQGGYTFSIAAYDVKIEDLVVLFEYGLEHARKYELKLFNQKAT